MKKESLFIVAFIGLIIILGLYFKTEQSTPLNVENTIHDTVFVHDTIPDTSQIEILTCMVGLKEDEIRLLKDSILYYKNRRMAVDENNRAALIQIREYVKICQNKPENKKFLLGWIIRALKSVGLMN